MHLELLSPENENLTDIKTDGQTGKQTDRKDRPSPVEVETKGQGTGGPLTGPWVGQVKGAELPGAGSGSGAGAKATSKLQPFKSECGFDC